MKAGKVKNKIWDYTGILTESWGPNNSFTLPKSQAAAMPRMCHATSPTSLWKTQRLMYDFYFQEPSDRGTIITLLHR